MKYKIMRPVDLVIIPYLSYITNVNIAYFILFRQIVALFFERIEKLDLIILVDSILWVCLSFEYLVIFRIYSLVHLTIWNIRVENMLNNAKQIDEPYNDSYSRYYTKYYIEFNTRFIEFMRPNIQMFFDFILENIGASGELLREMFLKKAFPCIYGGGNINEIINKNDDADENEGDTDELDELLSEEDSVNLKELDKELDKLFAEARGESPKETMDVRNLKSMFTFNNDMVSNLRKSLNLPELSKEEMDRRMKLFNNVVDKII